MTNRTSPRPATRLRAVSLVAFALSTLWLALVAWLAAFALLPVLLAGWDPTVIVSGSMSPLIRAGDVVLVDEHDGSPLSEGAVISFADHRGVLVTHRIAEVRDDGTYVTRGDANGSADSDPVAPADVVGVGRLLVPYIGAPTAWWSEGNLAALTMVVFGTMAAVVGATRSDDKADAVPVPRDTARQRLHRARSRLPSWPVAGLLLLLISIPAIRSSNASFTASASNGGNVWRAAASYDSDQQGAPTPDDAAPEPGDGASAEPDSLSPSPSRLYLGAPRQAGPITPVLPLEGAAPTRSGLVDYSTDARGPKGPGRVLQRSSEPRFDRAAEAAMWRSRPATGQTEMTGAVTLRVWARVVRPPGPWTGHELVAAVHAYEPASGDRRLLGSSSVHDQPFSPGDAWTQKDLAIPVDGVVRPGELVELHLRATDDNRARDMHLAFGTAAYPAFVELPLPLR